MKKILFLLIYLSMAITSCKKSDTSDNNINNSSNSGAATDGDGNTYKTVTIGDMVWMAENLKTSKFCNGDVIQNVTDNSQWDGLTTPAWSYNNNDAATDIPYGKLYNWYAVNDSRNICPCGWHVSTDAEWTAIENLYGGAMVSGGKLKETGIMHWPSPNQGADNSSGLTALPGGIRGLHGDFSELANLGSYWTGTENTQFNAWYRVLYYWQIIVGQNYSTKKYGMSVRCVKD